jgi:hypothetical protein
MAISMSAVSIAAMADVMVGGAPCCPPDIIDNAVNSKDHTTLVAAVKLLASSIRSRARSIYRLCAHQCRI